MEPWPEDPQDWSDEQWLAWLAETDEDADAVAASTSEEEAGDDGDSAAPWTRRTGLGSQMLGAAMTGMAEAIYGPREKPAIVIEAAGGPPDDEGLDVQLDFEHPEESIVIVRPWLLRGGNDDGRDDGAAP